jgi:hypothetical protein
MPPAEGPDPVLRPPFQTPIRVVEFPPGAYPPQPDEVLQVVLDTSEAQKAEVEAASSTVMFPPELLVPDDTPPDDTGGNGNGVGTLSVKEGKSDPAPKTMEAPKLDFGQF